MIRQFLALLFFLLTLSACGPSTEELNATATREAADHAATETAAAPTATPTSTSTPSPTSTPTPTSTPAPTSTPTPTPTPRPPDPQTLLRHAEDGLIATGSFRTEQTLTLVLKGEGFTMEVGMTFTGAIQFPDRFQGTIAMSLLGEEVNAEIIAIGDDTWVRETGSGEWTISPDNAINPADMSPTFSSIPYQELAFVGEETRDGEDFYHLQGTITDISDFLEAAGEGTQDQIVPSTASGGSFTVDLWIGKEDEILHEASMRGDMEIEVEDETFPEGTAFTIDTTVIYTDFSQEMDITAPGDSEADAAKQFTIGILGPFSGPNARTGQEFRTVAEMALENINYQIGDWSRAFGDGIGAQLEEAGWEVVDYRYFAPVRTEFHDMLSALGVSGDLRHLRRTHEHHRLRDCSRESVDGRTDLPG